MVTALVLQLIQCVVHLPSERETEDEHNKKVSTKVLIDFFKNPYLLEKTKQTGIIMYSEAVSYIWCLFSRWIEMSSLQTLMKLPCGRLRTSFLCFWRSKSLFLLCSLTRQWIVFTQCISVVRYPEIHSAFTKCSVCFRCGSKQGEEDYRPLFENFVHDLLSTVNKPEWPAAELLLSLLGRLLVSAITYLSNRKVCWCLVSLCHFSSCLVPQVHQFSNKQTEMALRVASLDYLGTVASRLRKDAVTSKMDQKAVDRILREVAYGIGLTDVNKLRFWTAFEMLLVFFSPPYRLKAVMRYRNFRRLCSPTLMRTLTRIRHWWCVF